MQAEELYHTLHRKPFQPFRVYLTDGRVYDIRYQHNNVVGTTFFVIGIPIPENPDVADHTVEVPLMLVDRVENLAGTASAAPT